MEINNRKAYYNYFVEEEIECGIVLKGTEIKSLRKGSVSIKDSYIRLKNNEAYIINMFIAKYEQGSIFNHDEYSERKLLLHKREIIKLNNKVKIEGFTLIPLKVYFKKNKAKILIGLCKGKKNYDKREALREKALKQDQKAVY